MKEHLHMTNSLNAFNIITHYENIKVTMINSKYLLGYHLLKD